MQLRVEDLTEEQIDAVAEAIVPLWNWDEDSQFVDTNSNQFSISGTSNLCGGESEQEFADRLSHAVWGALGEYHPIEITATYLENLPYETYTRSEDDYNEFLARRATT